MKKKSKKKVARHTQKHTKEAKNKISRALKGKKKSPEAVKKMKDNDNAKVWDFEKAKKLFTELIEWMRADLQNIFIVSFLSEKGLHKSTLTYLVEHYDMNSELSEMAKVADTMQEAKLVDLGFKGVGNPTITIFILKNNHGYKDKFETDNRNENLNVDIGEVKRAIPNDRLSQLAEFIVSAEARNGRD
jgi:hypothetical protein